LGSGDFEVAERKILNRIKDSIVNFDSDALQKACSEALDAGIPAYRCVTDGMAEGMRIVGEKFEAMEYFLCELIMAGETMNEGLKILEPRLKAGEVRSPGKVVIGTVLGDLHDIGKSVVVALLKSAGFEVVDLGLDVAPESFVEAVRKEKPDIVGMSALITPTMPYMGTTIKALEEAGLRKKVKVIVGGASVTPEFAKMIGADAFARDAVEGVYTCKKWMESR